MEKLSHAHSRRLYSWWWDSHISPKNSKWLHENLADMDIKVKAMIKIIEEDADSFRERAEMYYRKRPELIKLVEEFYRAYRALAERYDHATGALRQAHQTMTEAFPEQIPLILPDESTAESSSPSGEIRAPENEALMSSYPTAFKGDELFFEEFDATMMKEASRLSTTGEIFANRWARKELNFQNVETEGKDFADGVQKEVHLLSEEPQNLKNQIEHESIMRADKAEAEVEIMKGTVSELESEKVAISLQYKLSEEKISSLQEDIKKLNDEILIGMTKLRSVEYRCYQLEKENQSLQLELGLLKETVEKQKKELEKLNISLKGGDRYTWAENLGSQSQEEARVLSMKIQNMERIKVGLLEEIQWLKVEIGSLKEQTCSSTLEIKRLQDEIRFLEESNGKLENELGMQVVDKKSLQQEIWYLKSDKKDLEKRHKELMEQIGVVNLNVESLQGLAKELRDGTVELKELCKKHEDERIFHLEKFKFVENITEQNGVLEKSLSSANAELEELREKVKTLEEHRETLLGKISMHISEKTVLVMQIEAISQNMEKLSDKNELLENSLSDMNVELKGLRAKFNVLEELCQSLCDQNSNLTDENGTLVTELEIINRSLENLERRYSQLEAKNLNMEKEKEHILSQVTALQSSLIIEKEEHATLMHSRTSQLATLESQINVLQEKGCAREKVLEQEYHKIIYAQIENFTLQRSLHDVKEKNMLLSEKRRRYSDASKCQEKLISDLKKESYMEKKRLTCLSQCIEGLKTYILDAQDENQQLIVEKTVFLTLVEQYGNHFAELQSGNKDLEQESKMRLEELLVLRSEKHKILELNEQLRQNVHGCNQNLSDLREAYSTIQSDITQLIEENECFEKKIVDLAEENDTLKVDNSTHEAQRLNLEHLYLIFSSSYAERSLELHILSNKVDKLHLVNTGIEQEVRSLNEKLGDVEIENMNLKQSLVNMEECKSQLKILTDLLVQKEEELSEVNRQVEGLLMDVDDAKAGREELQNKNQTLLKYSAQLERMNRSLENLERRYSQLETKNLNMEKEKEHILSQVTALQSSLIIEKEEHATLMHSSTSQLATLESQINVLQEKGCAREEALEQEYHKIIYAQIEIFLLQRSLHDMKEKNMLLSDKCRRYSEASICQEKLISDLKKESYIEKKRLTCLSQCIESLKNYILDAQDENQQLMMEKTVFLTLVEQYGMHFAELQSGEKDLERESKTRLEELLVLRSEKHKILKLNEQLRQNVHACSQNLSDLREAYSTIQSDNTQLIEENERFAKKIVDLAEEYDTLKVDNSTLEAQRMNLEHLYLIFSSSYAERSLELQILSNKVDQLHLVNTGIEQEVRSLNEKLGDVEIENMNLKQSLVNMEECKSQLEILTDLLVQKEEELSEANHHVEDLLKDVDDAKAAREELQNKNQSLLKYKAQVGKENADLHQTNGTLTRQVGKLFEEVVEYKKREKFLISQLEDRNKEVECCEVEITNLINDAHTTTIGAVTFEEKMLDLLMTCESLEICATVQKEMLYEEIAKRSIYEDNLKEKLDSMDEEIRVLKNELNAYLPLISSLGNFVASLERHILFLANHDSMRHQEKQYSSSPNQQKRCIKEGNEDHNATLAFGIFELQKLHTKVNALESMVMDIQSHLEHGIFVSKTALQDGAGGSGDLKAKRAIDKEEDEAAAICKDIILHFQKKEETDNLMKGKDKSEQTMKDIQLDHVVTSSYYEHGSSSNAPSGIGSDETNDHMIELWETIDDSKMEKESSIEKLEITKKETEANQECNGSINERLSSDDRRLSVIQKTVKELIRNMEIYEPSNNLTSPEFKKVYLRSKEAEEAILYLIDTYKKLTKKAQQHDEMGNTNERKISIRARKGFEKIGRLELELLKIEYIWLKLKEEHDYKRARDAERRTRVLLRDYFYGRREGPRRKVHCCACLRPRTTE